MEGESCMSFNYNRYDKAIKWFGLQTKMNEHYQGGNGHFFPRSAIVTVFFGENVGYEKSGTRPAVIVSSDISNQTSGNIVVVPLTKEQNKIHGQTVKLLNSQYRLYKTKYKLNYNSIVQCEDIRVVSKERIGNVIDFVDSIDMKNINKRLKYILNI